jgi:hypothetical protein
MNILENYIDNNVINDTCIDTDIDTNASKKENTNKLLTRNIYGPSCGVIIIDNFYNNPIETRNFVLNQDFSIKGNFPGQRTRSYANEKIKDIIQNYVKPFGGLITDFPCPKMDDSDSSEIYNGSFQYTTSKDRSWIHTDKWNNWAGIVFLTPDAPLSSGTAFYRFYDGSTCETDSILLNNQYEVDRFNQDLTKWELIDTVGNVFNRLILFNAHNYHMSMDYFGDTKENGRLFQVFFFSTEK